MNLPKCETDFHHNLKSWTNAAVHLSMHRLLRFLRESDLRFGQFGALSLLAAFGPSTVSAIARHLAISNPAASQMLDRMHQMGMLLRLESKDDRRLRRYELSTRGREFLEEAISYRVAWIDDFGALLSPEELTQAAPPVRVLSKTMDVYLTKEKNNNA